MNTINNILENDLRKKEIAISTFIESKIKDRLPTEAEIKEYCNMYCAFLYPELTEEEKSEINKMLNNRFEFKLDVGTLIYDEEMEPWFKEFKKITNVIILIDIRSIY